MRSRTPPRDATGAPIRVRDVVRVLKVPDRSGMRPHGRRESLAEFEHILGTYKRVVVFNSLGWPELSFRILNGPHSDLHTAWIEPELLRVRRTRS